MAKKKAVKAAATEVTRGKKRCPHCEAIIAAAARTCPECKKEIAPKSPSAGGGGRKGDGFGLIKEAIDFVKLAGDADLAKEQLHHVASFIQQAGSVAEAIKAIDTLEEIKGM